MWILWTILGILGAFIVITLIRAAFWTPEKISSEPLDEETVDVEKYRRDLSAAIQIPTISKVNPDEVDWDEFQKLHRLFEERFPLVYKNLSCEEISLASLLFTWKGKNPDLEPIALLGHQDVVPVAEGTEQDWTHPAFGGVDDGEFIWGRGALDMKNHLIAVLESVESLLSEGFQPERTVYLCFGHDEEIVAAKTSGAGAIADALKARGVHLDSVLDEGGAVLDLKVGNILTKRLAGVGIGHAFHAYHADSIVQREHVGVAYGQLRTCSARHGGDGIARHTLDFPRANAVVLHLEAVATGRFRIAADLVDWACHRADFDNALVHVRHVKIGVTVRASLRLGGNTGGRVAATIAFRTCVGLTGIGQATRCGHRNTARCANHDRQQRQHYVIQKTCTFL